MSQNPLSIELNDIINIQNSNFLNHFLSTYGKQIFFPKGILSQSAEAKEKAYKYNATIGIAQSNAQPMSLDCLEQYTPTLDKKEIFNYAPSFGIKALREAWKKRILNTNPSLKDQEFSLPIVTAGLTQGLSLCSDLFFNQGDTLILPDQIWGNYKLIFNVRKNVCIENYPFFNQQKRFNIEGLDKIIENNSHENKTIKILINTPNNPTGYHITHQEKDQLLSIFDKYLSKGIFLLILLDDAYFGLSYEKECLKESLFAFLANYHPNLLAVKIDGATKEFFTWGYRLGFITLGNKGFNREGYLALEKKLAGAVRSVVSNCSTIAQNIISKELKNGRMEEQAFKNVNILKDRAKEVKKTINANSYDDEFIPYPFNAGYFMLIKLLNIDAESLRLHLLDKFGVGVIATAKRDIRIAFSCVEKNDISDLFKIIYKACKDLS